MPDENLSGSPDGDASKLTPEEHLPSEAATSASIEEPPQESDTGRMLREAIQRVMAEIEHHKKEAQKHLHRAEELKRDLRQSFASLPDSPGKGARPESSAKVVGTDGPKSVGGAKAKDVAMSSKRPSAKAKKK